MDIGALTKAITTTLIPALPYLLRPGDRPAGEKRIAGEAWEQAKELWAKLKPGLDAKPSALEAAYDAAFMPDDEDAQAALRVQLKKLLTEDQSLAEVMSRWFEQGKGAGVIVNASGERSVAIGGDVAGSTIITGDGNVIGESRKRHRVE